MTETIPETTLVVVTEDFVNLKEDGVSTEEAIDVKKWRKKKETRSESARVERKKEEQMWKWKKDKWKCFWCLMWQHKALSPTGFI